MKKHFYPSREHWTEICKRPQINFSEITNTVNDVLQNVRKNGDKALLNYSEKFDGIKPASLLINKEQILKAYQETESSLIKSLKQAADNIKRFHETQKEDLKKIETQKGVLCWRKSIAIEKVGLYIPGGTAPLFSSILMLAIPAKIAGCHEIILCTPPDKTGEINPGILSAAHICGIDKIHCIGGAQAIAAMAYGTETVNKVDKIFGPGNQYVTVAKQLCSAEGIAIDMPAGPSEVLVWADKFSNPAFAAADLLAQAEHGIDSQVVLVSEDEESVQQVLEQLERQLVSLPRKAIAEKALKNSYTVVLDKKQALDFINEYAAEHLIVMTKNAPDDAEKIVNAGSVFIGDYSPESAGDYASGTNHTLPTNAFAKAYSGVSLDSFVKKITFQQISKEGLESISETTKTLAAAESLEAHRRSVAIRLEKKDEQNQ